MISKIKKGTLQFVVSPDQPAKKVCIAGSFNDWEPVPMTKRSGRFIRNVQVPAGRYEYKFIVDGKWCLDPDNNDRVRNELGTQNSVAVVD